MNISDASGFSGEADQIFTPQNEEEIAQILTRATVEGVPVTIMGALTGLAGGAVPQGGWGISMSLFTRLDVFPGYARVGNGTLLRDVKAAAAASCPFYEHDPTEHSSSVGGIVTTNSSVLRNI